MKPKIRLYYDGRKCDPNERCPVYVKITHIGTAAYIVTDVHLLASEWNKETESVVKNPNKTAYNRHLNALVENYKATIDNLVISQDISRFSASRIKDILTQKPVRTKFDAAYLSYANSKKGGTKVSYEQTHTLLEEYKHYDTEMRFEDITVEWLGGFEDFLATKKKHKQNTIIIHLSHIRAVIGKAVKDKVISNNVFADFHSLKPVASKRALPADEIKRIMQIENHKQQYWLDMFKLSFLLVGLNFADMLHLTETLDGRIDFVRQKTLYTQRMLSLKIEPEAQALIDKYKGKKYVLRFLEDELKRKIYKNADAEKIAVAWKNITSKCDTHLKHIRPKLSTYWARHTWSSIAYNHCDISRDTIAQSLGHASGHKTTNIYISADSKRVDEANRKVIDFVLGIDKKEGKQ